MRTHILALVLCFVALPAMAVNMSSVPSSGATVRGALPDRLMELLHPDVSAFDVACCMMCKKGQPCGDACIARNKTCHVGPGCACQAPGY